MSYVDKIKNEIASITSYINSMFKDGTVESAWDIYRQKQLRLEQLQNELKKFSPPSRFPFPYQPTLACIML